MLLLQRVLPPDNVMSPAFGTRPYFWPALILPNTNIQIKDNDILTLVFVSIPNPNATLQSLVFSPV